MKTLLPFLLIFASLSQNAVNFDENSPMVVLGFKWSKSRQTVARPEPPSTAPAAALTQNDKNFERNLKVNEPAGVRDPNADTLDGRSAAIEKIVQESRSPGRKSVDGFAYQAKVRNAGTKAVEVVFWEYRFTESSNPSNVVRRQFLCSVNIKPNKDKELQALSLSGPSGAISVDSLGSKSGNPFEEKAVINRVEYADGSIWQRKGWNMAEMKPAIARAIGTPWGAEMCRSL